MDYFPDLVCSPVVWHLDCTTEDALLMYWGSSAQGGGRISCGLHPSDNVEALQYQLEHKVLSLVKDYERTTNMDVAPKTEGTSVSLIVRSLSYLRTGRLRRVYNRSMSIHLTIVNSSKLRLKCCI